MLDLSMIHNPYDFSNPVSDEELFTGREKELEEIKYYMEHAKKAPRPINIALLGPRASGKTSLLNICELEAKRRNLCTIRINLDESHAKNVPVFFYTIFNSILTEVCELGGYNGKNGKTYETYIDLISTYEIPPDKICCPFIFPLTYIKAKSKNNLDTIDFDDNMYQEDLKSLSSEIKCPIILLFDECNVLSKSRIILEKLRNIFMSTPGYMLIFTGTPDLFPVMDEVFSPIIRQFKKIKVDNFTSKDETKECIEKPLKKIKIDPESIFDYRYLDGIHELSGGHPYIIQLICHKLFQEVETRRANKMKLDQRIIDDITKERKTTQDINYSQTFNKIENLIPKEPDLNHNTKNIQKLTTKDITLEGEIEANFIFNKDNFELLGKKFVNLLKTVKKSEIIYFLILDDVANIEMKLPNRAMYYYDLFSCCNYEFNREKFIKLRDKIDLKKWRKMSSCQ